VGFMGWWSMRWCGMSMPLDRYFKGVDTEIGDIMGWWIRIWSDMPESVIWNGRTTWGIESNRVFSVGVWGYFLILADPLVAQTVFSEGSMSRQRSKLRSATSRRFRPTLTQLIFCLVAVNHSNPRNLQKKPIWMDRNMDF
jgi:hypothetical protein